MGLENLKARIQRLERAMPLIDDDDGTTMTYPEFLHLLNALDPKFRDTVEPGGRFNDLAILDSPPPASLPRLLRRHRRLEAQKRRRPPTG